MHQMAEIVVAYMTVKITPNRLTHARLCTARLFLITSDQKYFSISILDALIFIYFFSLASYFCKPLIICLLRSDFIQSKVI